MGMDKAANPDSNVARMKLAKSGRHYFHPSMQYSPDINFRGGNYCYMGISGRRAEYHSVTFILRTATVAVFYRLLLADSGVAETVT